MNEPTRTAEAPSGEYPTRVSVDYPEGKRNRLTVFFRLFIVIPIYILLYMVSGAALQDATLERWPWQFTSTPEQNSRLADLRVTLSMGGVLFVPTLVMILFRRKYPKWWFDWNLELYRFSARVLSYLALLRDEYPSTDETQSVHIDITYPETQKLNRWLPLVKWFLALPHFIVLIFLGIGAIVITVFAWFAIMLTGTYPKSLFQFVVGVNRWMTRVYSYAFLLTTDRYPPFSLQ